MQGRVRDRTPNVTVGTAVESVPGGGLVASASRTLRAGIVGIGFWAAVLMPLTYVPVLATGVQTQADGLLLLGLLISHAVALFAGHGHGR